MTVEHERRKPPKPSQTTQLFLSGFAPGRRPSEPHVISSPEEIGYKKEITALTGCLAQICERCATGILTETLNTDPSPNLTPALEQVLDEFQFVSLRTLRQTNDPEYEKYLSLISPSDEGELSMPKNKTLSFLLRELDRLLDAPLGIEGVLGVTLSQTYHDLTSIGGIRIPTDKTRYLVESALILGKLICLPEELTAELKRKTKILKIGHLVPNFRIPLGGKEFVEFDGIVLPQKPSDEDMSLDQLLTGNPCWLAEIKTLFKTEITTGPRKLRNPRRADLAFLQHQLGRAALKWSYQHPERIFPFPKYIVFIYLRGSLPHVVHSKMVDHNFFQNWIDGLGARFDIGLITETDDIDQVGQLVDILTQARDLARREYDQRTSKALSKWKEELCKGKPIQGILFENPSKAGNQL